MKAIIMAGGEGTRLRPVSSNRPKPMVDLVDKPVLEHIIRLLKANGVTEACLTLKYLPQVITDYFGSGEKFGLRLVYSVETEALGTAGGVRNCADFIGGEEFLVISGDCVCDFDLKALAAFHHEKKAEVTLALYSHREPTEYGLVITTEDGRIERFLEKPPWDNVLTDRINTGIYMIDPVILGDIPEGRPYDFGRNLFPRLLAENRAVYGCTMAGYWCDIGSNEAYLSCCLDILRGSVNVSLAAPLAQDGVWCDSLLPEKVRLIPPVYIGKNTVIDRGACVGPNAVIGESSVIAAGATVANSVVYEAVVNENACVNGAVVCRGATIGREAVLNEGSVVGEGCVIGEAVTIAAGARLWPERHIRPGAFVSGTLMQEAAAAGPTFTRPGVLAPGSVKTLTAEACLRLGEAAAESGRVGIGWSGGETARVLAEAFGCGVCAAGAGLVRHDGGFPSAASYAGYLYSLPLTVCVTEGCSGVTVTFFGGNGGRITRETERRFEAALAEPHIMAESHTGSSAAVTGVVEAYVSEASRRAVSALGMNGSLEVAVAAHGTENRALKSTLEMAGCSIGSRKNGRLLLEAINGGRGLRATDEEGYTLSSDQLAVIISFIEFSSGTEALAVPYETPAVVDALARDFGAAVLRIGRDGEAAEELRMRRLTMHDGVFAAAYLAVWLKSRGETLAALRRRMPKFSSTTREIELNCDRGSAMRKIAAGCAALPTETAAGLRFDTGNGYVYISPLREKSALKIRTESFSEETAEELCAEFERRVRDSDSI